MNTIYTVHEKVDGSGQLTIFCNKSAAAVYGNTRRFHQWTMNRMAYHQAQITYREHIAHEDIGPTSFLDGFVFTCTIAAQHGLQMHMFTTEAKMNAFVEQQAGNFQICSTRKYRLMYIQSKKEAAQYAKLVNDFEEWYLKLGTVSRFGKKNCVTTEKDLEEMGFDSAVQTTGQFINEMGPIAEKMFQIAKKQLAKMNPNRQELSYRSSFDDDSDEENLV